MKTLQALIVKKIVLSQEDVSNYNSYPELGVYRVDHDDINLYCVTNGVVYIMPSSCQYVIPIPDPAEPKEEQTNRGISHLEMLETIAVVQKPELIELIGGRMK